MCLIGLLHATREAFAYEYKKGEMYYHIVKKVIEKYDLDLDPRLVMGFIETESGFNPKAKSWAGARGLMQLMPTTAKWIDELYHLNVYQGVDSLYDPEINIILGCHYLNYLKKEFNGDWEKAIMAYNMGPGNIRKNKTNYRYLKNVLLGWLKWTIY